MSLALPTYLRRTFRCFPVCIYGKLKEVHEETDVPEESSVVSDTEHIANEMDSAPLNEEEGT